jgi:hypothetical protein
MWIFDGEQWLQDDGDDQPHIDRAQPVRIDEFYPELQLEVVIPTPRPVPPPPPM